MYSTIRACDVPNGSPKMMPAISCLPSPLKSAVVTAKQDALVPTPIPAVSDVVLKLPPPALIATPTALFCPKLA